MEADRMKWDEKGAMSWPQAYGSVLKNVQNPAISRKDREIIREYATRVAEIAAEAEQDKKRELWYKLNSLKDTRPLIFADPEGAWYEIIPIKELKCEGELARIWEFRLKKEIFWHEKIRDDRVIEPCFKIYQLFDEGNRGLSAEIIGGEDGNAFRWDSPLADYNDLNKLHFKQIRLLPEQTKKLRKLAEETLGDILEVRVEGRWWWSLGMTSDAIFLRGFERFLFDTYENPESLHKLMAFLRDENIEKLNYLGNNGLLTLNNGGDYIGTGGYGWSHELPSPDYDGRCAKTMDLWGFCESQETVGVSPAMFEEFVFAYQLPILERFGLNIYGCCEPLDKRFDIITRIPRLRKISVSPWSNAEAMAEKIAGDYVFTRKVSAADIAQTKIDEDLIREGLRKMFRATRTNNCHVEVLMRDVLTLGNNPDNIIRWTRLAREESENA